VPEADARGVRRGDDGGGRNISEPDRKPRGIRPQRDGDRTACMPDAIAASARSMVMGRTRVMLAVRHRLGRRSLFKELSRGFAAGRASVEQVGRRTGGAEGQRGQETKGGTAAAKHGGQS